jgi:asparagine synthase (glutamine-hydrolysing)
VPRELIERPKQGFAIPLSRWLRGELAPLIDEFLAPARIRDAGVFEPDAVARAVANFREGDAGSDRLDVQKVWHLLAFEMWRSRWHVEQTRLKEPHHARAVHY